MLVLETVVPIRREYASASAFAEPLDGRASFFAVYAKGMNLDVLIAGLGKRFMDEEVSFKPWPACRGTHPYIEAALALRDRVDIARMEAEIGPVQEMLIRPPSDRGYGF